MAGLALEVQCLNQLRDYLKAQGGDLEGDWKCKAQVRDYGSRAGSVDTWFTAPSGEVYRSKVAVARGIGLQPQSASAAKGPKKPKAPRKPNPARTGASGVNDKPTAAGATAATEDPAKVVAGSANGTVELSIDEMAELLLSMPCATDTYDVYEGLLFYKEAQLRHANKIVRAAADAAERLELEEQAAAAVKALAEADEDEDDEEELSEDEEMDAGVFNNGEKKQVNYAEGPSEDDENEGGEADNKAKDQTAGDADEGAEGENDGEPMEVDEGVTKSKKDLRKERPPPKPTRRSLACAVAATSAALKAHIAKMRAEEEEEEAAAEAAAGAAAATAAGVEDPDGEAPVAPKEKLEDFMPLLDEWQVEMEVIRKCMVKVPLRLGRPREDEPAPMSPTSRDVEVTNALLNLSDCEPAAAVASNDGEGSNTAAPAVAEAGKDKEGEGEDEDDGAEVACGHWSTKRFPLDQLCANDCSPTALHPAALFFLRYQQEEEARIEKAIAAAAAAAAAKREAKAKERAAALAAAGGGEAGEGGRPRLPLPKPANLSLRGKSIEEIEEALMERLASYVSDLGGVMPTGWSVKASVRQNGANAGGVDAYYYDNIGRRHKSMIKVAEALGLEASAAAKPRPLGSILGPRVRPTGDESLTPGLTLGGSARGSACDLTQQDNQEPQQQQQQEQQVEGEGAAAGAEGAEPAAVAGTAAVEAAAGAEGARAFSPAIAGEYGGQVIENPQTVQAQGNAGVGDGNSPGSGCGGVDEDGNRKTCGECRTCRNPQLKKGCLVNRAKKGDKLVRRKQPSLSPSPEPSPPKKLTARQAAKIERLQREKEEKEKKKQQEEEEEEDMEVDVVVAAAGDPAATPAAVPESAVPETVETAAENLPTAEAAAPEEVEQQEDPTEGEGEGEGDATNDAAGGRQAKQKKQDGSSTGGAAAKKASGDGAAAVGGKRSRGAGGDDAGGSGDDGDGDDDGKGKKPRRDEGPGDVEGAPNRRRQGKKDEDLSEEAKKKKEDEKAKRKEKREKRDNEVVKTGYDRAYNRLRSQLSRLRQEQALVMAYAADGWRGASREKVKPVAEIKRAKEQIARCKEVIRECVKVCDEAEGDKRIPAELFDSDGELDMDHIFCSKCGNNESTDDNDIILCDGHCDRAYHVKCLVPPVDPETLPEDEGWLCPSCDRKIDMIDIINDEFGTDYDYDTPWEQVLAPGTIPMSPSAGDVGSPNAAPVDLGRLDGMLAGADLPSEDEDDEDYEASGSDSDMGDASDGGGGSGSGQTEGNTDVSGSKGGASGSDDGGNDSDTSSLASEDLEGEIEDVEIAEGARHQATTTATGSEDSGSALIVQGKRRRFTVDYQALNKEMFGDMGSPDAVGGVEASEEGGEEEEEDDDAVWSPKVQALKAKKKRNTRRKKSEEPPSDFEADEEEEEGVAEVAESGQGDGGGDESD